MLCQLKDIIFSASVLFYQQLLLSWVRGFYNQEKEDSTTRNVSFKMSIRNTAMFFFSEHTMLQRSIKSICSFFTFLSYVKSGSQQSNGVGNLRLEERELHMGMGPPQTTSPRKNPFIKILLYRFMFSSALVYKS